MVGKTFSIIFSQKAKIQMRAIYTYHSQNYSSTLGVKIRKGIMAETQKLEKLPESKPLLPNAENLNFQVRYAKYSSYKIIFRVFPIREQVHILTIRHDKEIPEEIIKDL